MSQTKVESDLPWMGNLDMLGKGLGELGFGLVRKKVP